MQTAVDDKDDDDDDLDDDDFMTSYRETRIRGSRAAI